MLHEFCDPNCVLWPSAFCSTSLKQFLLRFLSPFTSDCFRCRWAGLEGAELVRKRGVRVRFCLWSLRKPVRFIFLQKAVCHLILDLIQPEYRFAVLYPSINSNRSNFVVFIPVVTQNFHTVGVFLNVNYVLCLNVTSASDFMSNLSNKNIENRIGTDLSNAPCNTEDVFVSLQLEMN